MSRRAYTAEEVTAGLLALVMWAGNEQAAARSLREQGFRISAATLANWKDTKSDEYNALRERHGPDLERELVRRFRELAMHAITVQAKAVAAAEKRLDDGKDIQPAQSAAALSRTVSTSVDKILTLTGRPATFDDQRTPLEILRGLIAAGVVATPDAPVELPAPDQRGRG